MTALTFLKFLWLINCAYVPSEGIALNGEQAYNKNAFELGIDVQLNITDYFFIGGNVDTTMKVANTEAFQFSPYFASYTFRAGAKVDIEDITLMLTFSHTCTHPISVPGVGAVPENTGNSQARFGGNEKITLTIGNHKGL